MAILIGAGVVASGIVCFVLDLSAVPAFVAALFVGLGTWLILHPRMPVLIEEVLLPHHDEAQRRRRTRKWGAKMVLYGLVVGALTVWVRTHA